MFGLKLTSAAVMTFFTLTTTFPVQPHRHASHLLLRTVSVMDMWCLKRMSNEPIDVAMATRT